MTNRRSQLHDHGISAGFTLIEVTIVLVIIAIFAALATPVIFNQDRRQMDHTAAQIADMLLMYAQRETMHPDPPGLFYDARLRELQLLTLPNDIEGDDQNWQLDKYVDPVVLPDGIELVQVIADSDSVDLTAWPLSTRVNEDRPAIRMTIEGAGRVITVELLPHALGPRVIEGGASQNVVRQPQDLDGLGRSREDW